MPAIPLDGDRAAKDVLNYPERHSTDLPAAPVYHVPSGVYAGDTLVWDGAKWILGGVIPNSIMTLGTREGELEVAGSPFKIYNLYGVNRTITKVFLSVETAPVGDDIIVDVAVDGISIFTGGNESTILGTEMTGESTTITYPTWASNSYLTWEILQVGSSVPGSNLVVHIVSIPASAGS